MALNQRLCESSFRTMESKSKGIMITHRQIGYIKEVSRIEAEELCVDWCMKDFNNTTNKRGDWFESPGFIFGDESWRLSMWPNWTDETRILAPKWMGLHLGRCDGGPPKIFHISVAIKGSCGMEMRRETKKEFSSYWGWLLRHFCSRYDLIHRRSRLTPDDNLHIRCIIKMPCSTRVGCKRALEDFGKLLASGENSDIIVHVGDVEFKAHKLILSSRCPVFAAMFLHDTAEKASNKITIQDCESDAFGYFLKYLYTGSVQSLTEQNAFDLYRIADKYLVDDLKQQCLEHIRSALSIQTFCVSVKLALSYEENNLLQHAIDFAAKKLPQIICTLEWQSLICEYPIEANDVLIKCMCKQS